jgi:hypothetical protein
MKDYMTHVAGVLGIMAMAFIVSYLITNQTNQVYKLKEQVYTISRENDSLKNELFISETIVTRYEITLDWFHAEHPKHAARFEEWLSKNTE